MGAWKGRSGEWRASGRRLGRFRTPHDPIESGERGGDGSDSLSSTSITARDYLLDICPNASLKHPAILSPRPAMSNETQKADQIAHRLYSKLALVVNHARATREPPPNAKVDRWVRSAVLSVPALY